MRSFLHAYQLNYKFYHHRPEWRSSHGFLLFQVCAVRVMGGGRWSPNDAATSFCSSSSSGRRSSSNRLLNSLLLLPLFLLYVAFVLSCSCLLAPFSSASAEAATATQGAVTNHRYCVIGAGPGGLQIGYYLQKAGRDYIIFEKANHSGELLLLLLLFLLLLLLLWLSSSSSSSSSSVSF